MTYGCARTPQSRFYILQPQLSGVDKIQSSETKDNPVIGVGPVEMPEYLDRPQIVTSVSNSELHFSEFNRWAESLEKNFSSVLAENLSALLSTDKVLIYPWIGSLEVKRQVRVNIIQFGSLHEDEVLLKVLWGINDGDGKLLSPIKKASFSTPAGKGYPEIVEAMNQVLYDFSRVVAKEIIRQDKD